MNILVKFSLTLFTFLFSQFAHGALWTGGHGDIGIGYDAGAIEPHWHLGEGGESVTLGGETGSLGPDGAEYGTLQITPYTALSQTIDGSSYFVFPATEDPTVPFIGFGTEELNPSEWTGDLTFSLTNVFAHSGASGGSFFLIHEDPTGPVTTLMDSSDGFSAADSILLTPNTHTHYTLAFSQGGVYDLTFRVDGIHSTGAKSSSAVYRFSVVPEPSTAGLLLGTAALALTVVRRRVSQ